MPFAAEPIHLSDEQRRDLNEIAQSRSLPAGFVFRAKLILMLADGHSFSVIKPRLQTTAPTIARWKQRFLEAGLEGLDTYHPGQKAVVLTPALRAKILAATRKKPKDGSTHWSCRKLAAAVGVSKDMVHRVWREAGLKPHRLERYLASDDPDFERKAADIIGLYLNPPQHAAVFCVDEKTAIQALDRLDPVLPLSPGRAERHGLSRAEVSGLLAGSPARINARATFDLDLRHVSQTLGLTTLADGRLQAAISAIGPVEALLVRARLLGDEIVFRRTSIRRAAAEALLDTATGELQIRAISASLFSGQLTGNAKIWTAGKPGRSEFSAKLAGLNTNQVVRAFGSGVLPAGPATFEVRASWPGLNWRLAAISGAVQSRSATVRFQAAADSHSMHASLHALMGDGFQTRGDIVLRLADHVLTGKLSGASASLKRTARDLEHLLDRPSGSLAPPVVDGAANWSATLEGTLAHPSVSVQAEVNGLSIGGWNDADLRIDADCTLERIVIRRARLLWKGQKIEAKGEISDASRNALLDFEGTVEGRSLSPIFENLGIAQVAEGSVSGRVRVTGSIAHPEVETTLNLIDLTVFGERLVRTNLDASWRDGELTVSRLRAEQNPESGASGDLEASGSFDTNKGRYGLNIVGQNLRLSTIRQVSGLALSGAFDVEAHGTGTVRDPMFKARVVARDVQAAGIAVGELRGEVEASDQRVTALLAAPALNVRATSTVVMERAWPFELTLDALNTRLNTTPASSFDVTARGSGSLARPRLERMTAAIRNLRLATPGQETVGDGPIEVSYADGRLEVERLALKSGESRLNLNGTISMDGRGFPGRLSVQGRLLLDRFSHLLPSAGAWQTGGFAEVSATLTGNGQHWTPAGSVTVHDGSFRSPSLPFLIENVAGQLSIADGVIRSDQITGKAGTAALRIDGSLPLRLLSNVFPSPAQDAGQAARFSARLDHLVVSAGKGEQSVTATVGVKVTGEAPALNVDQLKATADFSELIVKTRTGDLGQVGPMRITIADGLVRLEGLNAEGANSSVNASGSIVLRGDYPLRFDVAGQTDLAIFAPLTVPLEAAGVVRLKGHVEGTLAEPRTTGFVTLEQATLALPHLRANGVKLNAILEDDQISLREFSGFLNGGAFSGGGDLRVRGETILNSNLFLNVKDAFAEYPTGVKTTSSLNLKLVFREDRPVLEGQIEVQEGYYEASLDLFGSGQFSGIRPALTPEAKAGAVGLDIRITTKTPVEMNNNLGRLAATANLRVSGTTDQPRVVGTLTVEPDGKLYFGDRTYYIERGSVRFLDALKITPELNIHAYTRSGDYTVNLGLTGELKEVTTTSTSDPPLSRDDVIAVLLTGKTMAENRGVDLRSLEAYSLAVGAMNASLSSQLHRTLGVSRVSIQPGAVAAESNPGARITITQDFTRSLRLLYSMNLSDSNDQIWVTEYDLSRRFTTRAVKQSDNTYRGEFRHDLRFGSSSAAGNEALRTPERRVSKVEFTGADRFPASDLAKRFKVKPGQKFNPLKLRKGVEKVTNFLMKEGYLESRLRVDREDNSQGVSLTVRMELGPTMELVYPGASLPRRQKARVRKVWRAGISNQQRPQSAKDAILDYFAEKGYLRAQVAPEVLSDGDHKLVRFEVQPGKRYRSVKIAVEGPENHRAEEILAIVQQRHLRLSVYRDPRRATEAITRYYEQRGYLLAKIAPPVQELDVERWTARIVIPTEEGPVFRVRWPWLRGIS